MDIPDSAWTRGWTTSAGHPLGSHLDWHRTNGGAWLGFGDGVVVKVHPRGSEPSALASRVAAAASPGLRRWLLAPLTSQVGAHPGDLRPVTLWPRVPVLHPRDATGLPWSALGAQLAGLHRAPAPPLPRHGGPERVARAHARVAHRSDRLGTGIPQGQAAPHQMLAALGERLLAELRRQPLGATSVVHGDWHLGQLARMPQGWRLLDVDDLGVGDPAWDLGRPAGFWAAGLVPDEDWTRFLDGYRAAGGPAVPPTGDPWPRLDLAARCAVFVAACRGLTRGEPDPGGAGSKSETRALLAACTRM